jgi:hypothetical protein
MAHDTVHPPLFSPTAHSLAPTPGAHPISQNGSIAPPYTYYLNPLDIAGMPTPLCLQMQQIGPVWGLYFANQP